MAILWREINKSVEPKDKLLTYMVEHIEDPLYSVPCDIIKNGDCIKCMFCYDAVTLRAHDISKTTAQTKREIGDEVNSLVLGKGSNKRMVDG